MSTTKNKTLTTFRTRPQSEERPTTVAPSWGRSRTTLAKSPLLLYRFRKLSNSSSGTFALIASSNLRARWLMTFALL